MLLRDDIHGRRAPKWLQQVLLRRYGATPFGEPRFRLVWAPSRFEKSGGEWTDWDPQMRVADRGKRLQATGVLRRVAQMRTVPKYPGEQAWLIERWIPPKGYGDPETWYRPVAEGGTLLPCGICSLGDYPSFGDYEDIGCRMYWYPTEKHVTTAIDAVERRIADAPASPLGRARRRTYMAEQEQERRDAEYDALAADVFDDAAPAFAGAPMIGYGGSHRPALVEMAESIGIRQHPL